MDNDALKYVGGFFGGGVLVTLIVLGIICVIIVGIPVVIAIIVAVICVFDSTQAVSLNNYGVMYNKVTGKLYDDEVFSKGRYWNGPRREVVEFPSIIQQMYFSSMDIRSFDGLELNIGISFQYLLEEEVVIPIYKRWRDEWIKGVSECSRSQILFTCSQFYAIDFINDQTNIAAQMLSELQSMFDTLFSDVSGTIDVSGLQLLTSSSTLPSSYTTAINEKQAASEEILNAQQEYDNYKIQQDNRVDVAKSTAQRTILSSQGTELGKVTSGYTTIPAEVQSILDKSESYQSFSSNLGFSNSQLLTYMWIENLDTIEQEEVEIILSKPQNLNY